MQQGSLKDVSRFQSYVNKIQNIQQNQDFINAPGTTVIPLDAAKQYAATLSGISNAQAALLLSTQGLTNADIQRTLTAKGLSTELQYQAMAEAGLLSSKKELLASDLKAILTSQLQSEERANEVLASMGLSIATEAEGQQTIKLTTYKLARAQASKHLTEAEAKELGLTLGVSAATNIQATTTLPKWIMSLRASTAAIWKQVAATATWMATNPAGWITAGVLAIGTAITAIFTINKAIDKHRQKIIETGETASENIQTIRDNLSNMKSSVENACTTYEQLQAGVDVSNNTNLSLSDENFQKFLDTNNQLAELFPELIKGTDAEGNAILNLGSNAAETAQILNDMADAKRRALGTEVKDNMTDVMDGLYESTRDARTEIRKLSTATDLDFDLAGLHTNIMNSMSGGQQQISLSKDYSNDFDSEELLNSITDQLNERFGTNLSTAYDDWSNSYVLDLTSLTTEQYQTACTIIANQWKHIAKVLPEQYDASASVAAKEMNQSYKANVMDILTGLDGDSNYNNLDTNLQNMARQMVTNLNYAQYADEIKGTYSDDIYQFFNDKFLTSMATATSKDRAKISQLYSNILSLDPDAPLQENAAAIEQYTSELSKLLGDTLSADDLVNMFDLGDFDSTLITRAQTAITDDLAENDPLKEQLNDYIAGLNASDLNLILSMSMDERSQIDSLDELEDWLDRAHTRANAVHITPIVDTEAFKEALADASEEVADAQLRLNDTQLTAANASQLLKDATINEIAGLINENTALGNSCDGLYSYMNMKLSAAGSALSTSSDIDNLINLCSALDATSTYLVKYSEFKKRMENGESPTGYWKSDEYTLESYRQSAVKEVKDALTKYKKQSTSSAPATASPSSSDQRTSAKEYNWMETAITRCTEALSRLKTIQENTFLSWSSRNQALNQEIAETGNQISMLSQIYAGYMAQADASGLSEDYKAKVRDGSMQIESISDAGLQDRIDQYQQWYKAAADIQSQIEELNRSLADLALKEFESIQSQFENRLSDFTNTASRIQDEMDLIEAKGHVVSQSMYRQLISNEKANRQELTSEREQLLRSLNAAIASGHLISGSEQWYEMQKKIQDVEAAIRKADQSLQDYNNSLRQLKWDAFDRMQEKLSGQIDESEYLRKLLEQEDTTDASGKHGLSKYGVAELDIRGANYQIYLEQIRKYKSEIASLDKQIAKDPGNQTLLERRQKLVEAQRESTLAAREEKQAMIELARKGYDAIIDSMEELISKKKEALKSEQDLYEYQKSIAEKTKNIATLEKQRAAYSNDTSEEGRKRLQEITVKLQEAQEDLKDTEYQKWISTQEDMMDQALSDYQTFVDEKFSDTDALIEELLTTTDENQSTTNRVLAELAKAAGYKLSEDLLKRIRAHNEIIYHVTPDLPLVYGNVTGAAAPVQSYSREYELALQNLLQTTAHPSLPAQSVNSGDISIRIDQMNLPNVTRPEEFSRSLITALQNDSNVVKSIQAVSTDLIAGKSIHRVRRY